MILIHDIANERVRSGVDAVRFAGWPKVAHVELDWIPGQLFAQPKLRNELWYGIGLVLVDSAARVHEWVGLRTALPPVGAAAEGGARPGRRSRGRGGGDDLAALRARVAELTVELVTSRGLEPSLRAKRAAHEAELAGCENGSRAPTGRSTT